MVPALPHSWLGKTKLPRGKQNRTTKEARLREDPGNEDIVPADVRALNASLWDSDHDDDDRMSDPSCPSMPRIEPISPSNTRLSLVVLTILTPAH